MRSFNENWDGIVRNSSRQHQLSEATSRKFQKAFDEMKKVVNRDLTWKKATKSFSDFKAMYMTLARSGYLDIGENTSELVAFFEFIKSKGGDRTKFRKLMKEMTSMKSYADYDATDTRWSFFSPNVSDKTLKDWFADASGGR